MILGDQKGTIEIFLSVSQNPWRYIETKGSVAALKIGSLFNNNEKIQERGLIEEQDAEQLMNEIDIELDAEFDQNLIYGGRSGLGKNTSEINLDSSSGNIGNQSIQGVGHSGIGGFLHQYNMRKSSQNTAQFFNNNDSANINNNQMSSVLSHGLKSNDGNNNSRLNMRIGSGNYFKRSDSNNTNHNSRKGSINYELKQIEGSESRPGAFINMKLADMNAKTFEYDYMDRVPGNCCMMEIKQIYDSYYQITEPGQVQKPKDTIFIGTYDGSLHSMRMETKKEDNSESYILINLKKWTFSYPITSLLLFDYYNYQNDAIKSSKFSNLSSSNQKNKSYGNLSHLQSPGGSNSQVLNNFSRTIMVGKNADTTDAEDNSRKVGLFSSQQQQEQQSGFNPEFYQFMLSSYQTQQESYNQDPQQKINQATQKIPKKSTIIKNYHANAILTQMASKSYNDCLMIISFANNSLIPTFYSNKHSADADNVKLISDITNNISEFSKPYLSYIHNNPQGELEKLSDPNYLKSKSKNDKKTVQFAVATNDGGLITMKAYQLKNKDEHPQIDTQLTIKGTNQVYCQKKQEYMFSNQIMSISNEQIQIKIVDIEREQIYLKDALMLASGNGSILFQIIDKSHKSDLLLSDATSTSKQQFPNYFQFELDMRVKAVKVGSIRLYGNAEEATQCLFVFTYEDFALVFYDFLFEINTMHISFKNKMTEMKNMNSSSLGVNASSNNYNALKYQKQELKNFLSKGSSVQSNTQKVKQIKNPIILKLLESINQGS
ncbi:UNKNOWN [Stylonychia lemnae]|uniref:Uncharacterized protein n=1 Tax=Stylonychia lemnae TaxID=5949 RepID=A0A078B6F3_STYLE|nr:UNKNOWN [Stylonychia lemnae]|eukprot:CDW89949.1 UNKNOWN [Stylonychia lemnae]